MESKKRAARRHPPGGAGILTLFAIVGISFVLYADAEAASARVAREAETQQRADMDPQQALAFFLGQLIYDVNDDATGVRLRLCAATALLAPCTATTPLMISRATRNLNDNPFNGVGRLHTDGNNWPSMNPYRHDDYRWSITLGSRGITSFAIRSGTRVSVQNNPKYRRRLGCFYVGCNAPTPIPTSTISFSPPFDPTARC